MKKTLYILLLSLVSIVVLGCGDSEAKMLEGLKREIRDANSFKITVNGVGKDSYTSDRVDIIDFNEELVLNVSLNEEGYDFDYSRDYVSDLDTEYEYHIQERFKFVNNDAYGKYMYGSEVNEEAFWVTDEYIYSTSNIVQDWLYTYETKEDVKLFLVELSDCINSEKNDTGNYLINNLTYDNLKSSLDCYTYADEFEEVNDSDVEAYFDVNNKSFVIQYKFHGKTFFSDTTYESNINVKFSIESFSSEAVTIKAPETDEVFSGVSINTVLTDGVNTAEFVTFYGNVDITVEYKNENDEMLFYVNMHVEEAIEYGVPFTVIVDDAAGWNGQILGDTIPYATYFNESNSFQMTVYEDGTFTTDMLSIPEILEWYNSKS